MNVPIRFHTRPLRRANTFSNTSARTHTHRHTDTQTHTHTHTSTPRPCWLSLETGVFFFSLCAFPNQHSRLFFRCDPCSRYISYSLPSTLFGYLATSQNPIAIPLQAIILAQDRSVAELGIQRSEPPQTTAFNMLPRQANKSSNLSPFTPSTVSSAKYVPLLDPLNDLQSISAHASQPPRLYITVAAGRARLSTCSRGVGKLCDVRYCDTQPRLTRVDGAI